MSKLRLPKRDAVGGQSPVLKNLVSILLPDLFS